MALGVALLITVIIIALIWVYIEVKRFRHKAFAISLILIILFLSLTFNFSVRNKGADLTTIPGFIQAGKIYFIWLGHAFNNVVTVTGNVIHMNWGFNNSTTGS